MVGLRLPSVKKGKTHKREKHEREKQKSEMVVGWTLYETLSLRYSVNTPYSNRL